jgi:nicotinamide mononucleotide (NMN) deamidase PncC
VYIGIAAATGSRVAKLHFSGDREVVRSRAAAAALALVLRHCAAKRQIL